MGIIDSCGLVVLGHNQCLADEDEHRGEEGGGDVGRAVRDAELA
jgi:hypothetical protein